MTPVAVLTPPQPGHDSRVLLARRERGGTETRALIAGATVTAGASAKLVARRLEATRPRRSTTSGAIEVVMLAVELPSISAGRRAIIYRASRGWSARLWSNARAAVRMFIHRRPRCELPHLPRIGVSVTLDAQP